jgi:hypothetical protein
MAHFYGFIQGQAGDATRMGSKNSGYSAWAQSHEGRIRVELRHNDYGETERDEATISIEGGYSAYSVGTSYLPTFDLTAVPAALSCGDPKVDRIWERIRTDFAKLDAEAPKALKRAKRRARKAELQAERERIAHNALLASMSEQEIAAYKSLRDCHDHDYALRLLSNDYTLERKSNGHIWCSVSDWDMPTGMREVNLTTLAATMPQDALTRSTEGTVAS